MRKTLLILVILLLMPVTLAKSGHMSLLAVSEKDGIETGTIADLYLEIVPGQGRVFIDTFPLTKLDTQLSTRFAKSIACNFLDKDCSNYDFFYTIRAKSSIVGGPSASGAVAVLTIALLDNLELDEKTAMTGTINSGGIIGPVGSVAAKVTAAQEANFTKVLIPEFGIDDELKNSTKDLGIGIVNISTLEEAIFEFTGKKYNKDAVLTIDADYQRVMGEIAEDLCNRARSFSKSVEGNNSFISSANVSLEKAEGLIRLKKYYSAASYCFTSNIKYHYAEQINITRGSFFEQINITRDAIKEFEDTIDRKEIKTLIDLQTFMIVKERIIEAKENLNESQDLSRRKDQQIYSLVFAIERLNSAKTWSQFFDTGKKNTIKKENLKISCINKLAEAEERLQYANLYYPGGLKESEKELRYAYEDAENGDYDLCLFKASKAKANADLILTTIRLQKNQTQELLDKKFELVEDIIANNELFFPIIGYSYYEYAGVLREDDEMSALVFLEYALELSGLDLYFQKEQRSITNYIDFRLLGVFAVGLGLGLIMGVLIRPRKKNRIKF